MKYWIIGLLMVSFQAVAEPVRVMASLSAQMKASELTGKVTEWTNQGATVAAIGYSSDAGFAYYYFGPDESYFKAVNQFEIGFKNWQITETARGITVDTAPLMIESVVMDGDPDVLRRMLQEDGLIKDFHIRGEPFTPGLEEGVHQPSPFGLVPGS